MLCSLIQHLMSSLSLSYLHECVCTLHVLHGYSAIYRVQCANISESPDMLLAEGKRCLAAGDANGAVECFQEACGLL